MAAKTISLMVTGLLAVILLGVLASIAGEKALSNDLRSLNSDSGTQTILTDNGTTSIITDLTGMDDYTLTATRYNDTYLSFDGVNDYINLRTSINPGLNMSISVWVWTNSTSLTLQQIYVPGGTKLSINDTLVIVQATNLIGNNNYVYGTSINDSLWHHLVATQAQADGNITLYIDNILQESFSGEPLYTSTTGTESLGGVASTLNGNIDEVRIYNRSLSDTEIVEIYNSGRVFNSSLPSDGLVLWLPLNENSGTDVHGYNMSDFT